MHRNHNHVFLQSYVGGKKRCPGRMTAEAELLAVTAFLDLDIHHHKAVMTVINGADIALHLMSRDGRAEPVYLIVAAVVEQAVTEIPVERYNGETLLQQVGTTNFPVIDVARHKHDRAVFGQILSGLEINTPCFLESGARQKERFNACSQHVAVNVITHLLVERIRLIRDRAFEVVG